ncbi:MAG: aminoacyl-histidine dipeptidase [Ruminococcus sp.]|jgi:dipeptidase D
MLENLKPERVFYYFEEISKIPRSSWNTGRIAGYLETFAITHNLAYHRDVYDNVIIYKRASEGYEDAAAVILQGHTDMVTEQEEGWNHNFDEEGIVLCTEGDFVRAEHTTLGADDGIAVAFALAILEDDSLPHPSLEVLLTSNEEVGLLGAEKLDSSLIRGKYLINLDSEEEGFLLCGCAGGLNLESCIPVSFVEEKGTCYEIRISGLKGGHSGMEIIRPRANANKLMGRFLFELKEEVPCLLADISGGKKHNVIASFARAVIVAGDEDEAAIQSMAEKFQDIIRREYAGEDDEIILQCRKTDRETVQVLHPVSMEKIVFYLMNQPHGVIKMSGLISDMAETSANAAVMSLDEEGFHSLTSIRSSLESAKTALENQICYLTEFLGGECSKNGDYPAWEYEEHSPLRDLACRVYQEMFQKPMQTSTIHAGLECGLLKGKAPSLDCVSFGPDIFDVHSPKERLSVSSTQRMWSFLLNLLKNMKSMF